MSLWLFLPKKSGHRKEETIQDAISQQLEKIGFVFYCRNQIHQQKNCARETYEHQCEPEPPCIIIVIVNNKHIDFKVALHQKQAGVNEGNENFHWEVEATHFGGQNIVSSKKHQVKHSLITSGLSPYLKQIENIYIHVRWNIPRCYDLMVVLPSFMALKWNAQHTSQLVSHATKIMNINWP